MDTDGANRLIGARLESLRRSKLVSRDALFKLTGVPAVTINRIEKGERGAVVPTLAALTHALGVPVAEFLESIQDDLDKLADADSGEAGD